VFFASKGDSIKIRLVKSLNGGAITEAEAWRRFAINIHKRAHSYREDVDSGLDHLGLLDIDGRPTSLGYSFVDACERGGDANSGTPKRILGKALLTNGQIEAFLHYVYKLSESKFENGSLPFSTYDKTTRRHKFEIGKYLEWLEDSLCDDLKVLRKVSARGGKARRPLQGELTILRNFGYVSNFRPGVGLVINWPKVQEDLGSPDLQ
jgi:hypothetical protein